MYIIWQKINKISVNVPILTLPHISFTVLPWIRQIRLKVQRHRPCIYRWSLLFCSHGSFFILWSSKARWFFCPPSCLKSMLIKVINLLSKVELTQHIISLLFLLKLRYLNHFFINLCNSAKYLEMTDSTIIYYTQQNSARI